MSHQTSRTSTTGSATVSTVMVVCMGQAPVKGGRPQPQDNGSPTNPPTKGAPMENEITPLTPREAKLLGEVLAYREALKEVLTGHPYLHLLHGRIQSARERGVAFLLGEPSPDEVQASYERAMDQIAATLPARHPSS